MCGINGIYSYDSSPVNPVELRVTRDYMASRGPDGSGEWYSSDSPVALGHRRLAILDLSETGAQPMSASDNLSFITYNGEIYNYAELRRHCDDYPFRSHSDTEVLLALYQKYELDMFRHLRGMYSFGLWDGGKHRLILARDPYGIKPLYYADNRGCFRFASQVKALKAGRGISLTRDDAGLAGFYLLGSVPEPFTLFREIRSLPAGSYMIVDQHGPQAPRFHTRIAELLRDAPERDAASAAKMLTAALRESIDAHLVSDVPVGVFLSSGIDSGAILGIASEFSEEPLTAITVGFDELAGTDDDERPLAEQVAMRYRARYLDRLVDDSEFRKDLPEILEAMDQPSIDGVNTWFVAKAAREAGLKVALSGLGGDELLGGYPSFRRLPQRVRSLRLIPHAAGRGMRKMITPLISATPASPKLAGFAEYGGTWEGSYLLQRGLFMPWELPELMGKERAEAAIQTLNPLSLIRATGFPEVTDDHSRVSCMESCLYMRNQLLRDADWAGMAHSVEIRVPLVDSFLIKAAGSSSALFGRNGTGKRALAQSPACPLPEPVVSRPKTGFFTPVAEWQSALIAGSSSNRRLWARSWAKYVISRDRKFQESQGTGSF